MPSFSKSSAARLRTCDPRLQILFIAVVAEVDCTILEGYRTPERQRELYLANKSQVLRGRHNERPSQAVDVAPSPIDWNDVQRFERFAAKVLRIAKRLDIAIRWGGNWLGDWDGIGPRPAQSFDDLVHFELRDG